MFYARGHFFVACQDRISGAWAWTSFVLAAWNAHLQQGLGTARKMRMEAMEKRKPMETYRTYGTCLYSISPYMSICFCFSIDH